MLSRLVDMLAVPVDDLPMNGTIEPDIVGSLSNDDDNAGDDA